MSYIVKRNIPRASPELLQAFAKIPTTIASDILNRQHMMHAAIKPIQEKVHMVGSAVTVDVSPGNNLMSHQALYIAKPGDVMVIDGKGFMERSAWGGIQTMVAIKQGLAGIVIDGTVRDWREIKERGLPVFCKGATPAGPLKETAGSINIPITCGGLKVEPGDIVIGDDDGVVVIPLSEAARVLTECKRRILVEAQWVEGIDQGKTTLEVLRLEKKFTEFGVQFED